MKLDARKEEFEYVEVFDEPALFTPGRISQFTVPKGWYCYDLRGKDDDPGDPYTIEKHVGINHAGSILTPKRIPFGGKKYVKVDEALDFVGGDLTLEEFCAEQGLKYPADTRKHIPRPAFPSEAGFFYALPPEEDKRLGGVGHLRMDFDRTGNAFHSQWFGHNDDKLNTPEFKAVINEVVDELRQTVLKDRAAMRAYCADHGGELNESCGIRQYGYVVETDNYLFCLRCKPQEGDYDGYLWCFDKREQKMEMEKQKEPDNAPMLELGGM